MKIYRRDEFMKLPAGTIFAKGRPWAFDDLSVKGETNGDDWEYRPLMWIENNGDSDQWSKLDAMLERGASQPIAEYEQRDGSFNHEDIFLVYEPTDLLELEKAISKAYRAYVGNRPVPHVYADHELGLDPGLYEIQWKNGEGVSVACVGVNEDGTRWIAAANWVRPCTDPSHELWGQIEAARLIARQPGRTQ